MKTYLTPDGLKKIREELEYLRLVERKRIAQELNLCQANENLEENSEYYDVREAQLALESRILELEDLVRNAVVVSKRQGNNLVCLGSTVLVKVGRKNKRFKVVGAEEVEPLAEKVSVESPLGKAIFHQPRGAIVEIETPQGRVQCKILKIQ